MENNTPLDQLFQQARVEQPEATFPEVKAKFQASLKADKTGKGGNGTASLFTLKNGIIMLSFITVITLVTFLILPPASDPEAPQAPAPISEKEIPAPAPLTDSMLQAVAPLVQPPEVLELQEKITVDHIEIEAIFQPETLPAIKQPEDKAGETPTPQVMAQPPLDTLFAFPKLTPDEVESNHKQKKKMIRLLAKKSKSKYVYVPSGTFESEGKTVSVNAFYMQTTEVTNLEYRTFLFDLLIQNRKKDFLKAKPDQSQWTHQNGNAYPAMKPMEDHYFSHPAYDNYPVNNISREGAKMYCEWLTIEARKGDKRLEAMSDIRLPSNFEWRYAASSGGKWYPYPWCGPNYTNAKGCYLANFWALTDTIPDNPATKANESLGGAPADGGMFTVGVNSYVPNDFGLFNMSGNVAEMVEYHNDNYSPGALGGGWFSPAEEIRIDGKDPFRGINQPNVNIGFRVVISHLE